MEGGHTIHAVVHKKIVGKQGLNLIWKDIERISQILKQKGIAHTDIKPANIAVKFFSQDLLNFRVFLIDNDDVVSFGDLRRVGTRGMNVKESWPYH
jgi:serine/threonine protein kinase